MKGKELEKLVLHRLEFEQRAGRCTAGRYGVQGVFMQARPPAAALNDVEALASFAPGYMQAQALTLRERIQAALARSEWQPLQSLPDIDGVLKGGRQFTFDCKAISSRASFPLTKLKKTQERQLNHLLTRGDFGAIAFFLMHFTARTLSTKEVPEATYAFPCLSSHPFWIQFSAGEVSVISRDDAEHYGVRVEWNAPGRMKNPTPDILAAVEKLSAEASYA